MTELAPHWPWPTLGLVQCPPRARVVASWCDHMEGRPEWGRVRVHTGNRDLGTLILNMLQLHIYFKIYDSETDFVFPDFQISIDVNEIIFFTI